MSVNRQPLSRGGTSRSALYRTERVDRWAAEQRSRRVHVGFVRDEINEWNSATLAGFDAAVAAFFSTLSWCVASIIHNILWQLCNCTGSAPCIRKY